MVSSSRRRARVVVLAALLAIGLAGPNRVPTVQGDVPSSGAPFAVIASGLERPAGVAAHPAGFVALTDTKAGVLYRLLPTATGEWARETLFAGLDKPVGLAVEPAGHLLIAEQGAGRVVRLAKLNGVFSAVPEPILEHLKQPRWLALAPEGAAYLSAEDVHWPQGQKPTPKPKGDLLLTRAPAGALSVVADRFKQLRGLAVSPTDGTTLYAVATRRQGEPERGGGTLYRITLPEGTVTPVIQNRVAKPEGVAVDALGAVWLTAKGLRAPGEADDRDEDEDDGEREEADDPAAPPARKGVVLKAVFTPAGALDTLTVLAAGLGRPMGLAVEREGHLVVAERKHGRVLRFTAPAPPVLEALPRVTNQRTLTVRGTAAPDAKITILGGTEPATGLADAVTGAFAVDVTLTPNTEQTLRVYATGARGEGLTSAPTETTVTHDDLPPDTQLTGPSGTLPTTTATFTVSGTDNFTPSAQLTFAKSLDGAPFSAFTAGATITLTNLTPGPHTLRVVAQDEAGNVDPTPAEQSFTVVLGPAITGFVPTSGPVGTAVTITGQGFDAVAANNQVKFNGTPAIITSATTTALATTVPQGATTGVLTVTTPQGTATSATNFIVLAAPPAIIGFTPTHGRLGTFVTITGTNFDPSLSGNQVTIGGVAAQVQSATGNQLVIKVPVGAVTGLIAITTTGGTTQTAAPFTVIAITALSVTPIQATLPQGSSLSFRGTVTFADQSTLGVTSLMTWTSSNTGSVTVSTTGAAQSVALGTATITGAFGTFNGTGTVQVIADTGGGPPPPDPATVAPPLDKTVVTSMLDATAFLYTGTNPIQTGVAPGTIEAKRAAVLRGSVKGRDGFPIPGVTITILNHPEFGQTLTRPDGLFDLAVNGGGLLTVTYSKTGYLAVTRQVEAPWQEFALVSDVVMILLDAQVTVVDLTTASTQAARGSVVTDTDGSRQATLLFAPGTTAVMTMPGGGTQSLTTVNVRATEYTVRPTFHEAVPATLPDNFPDVYTVEFSVDEAIAAGATEVRFNQPVISYLENFYDFPVGTSVPVSSYDRAKAQWVPSSTGWIVKIVSVSGGVAELDTNGDGIADSPAVLATFGITTAERQKLATLYQTGQSLWRTPLTHFTTYYSGCNTKTPADAEFPTGRIQEKEPPIDQPCEQNGSVIGCENQSLGEAVALTGTPFRLHYQSDRVLGRTASQQIEVQLSKAAVPASLKRIELEIVQGGRLLKQTFAPTPNQTVTVTWDGLDPYGRAPQGPQPNTVRVGYVYDGFHVQTGQPRGREFTLWQSKHGFTGPWDARAAGLGGWSLNIHHVYDPFSLRVYLGGGQQRRADAVGQVINTVAGTGVPGYSGDGGKATEAQLQSPHIAPMAPDGSLNIPDSFNHRLRRVAPDGIITTIAGTGLAGSSGDGGPATAAQLNLPVTVVVAPDGALYFTEFFGHRLRRIGPNGIITTVAGTGVVGFSGDGGPATAAQLNTPYGVTRANDGTLYITDANNHRIRRISTDGIITTVAGTGVAGFSGDGGPATAAQLKLPEGIVVAPNGSLYFADVNNHRIRRVSRDGIITTVAGTGVAGFSGDGGPATAARLNNTFGLGVDRDGMLYVVDTLNHRVRRVGLDGIISTVVGSGIAGDGGDGGPATAAIMLAPAQASFGPDGSLYLGNLNNNRIRRVAPVLPGFTSNDFLIPAEDGSELYVFSGNGRHLRTQDLLTNATRYQFTYDSTGLLTAVTDVAGQVTTIERDGSGAPTAIVVPGGQRTTLVVEANGYLATITNPNNETTQLTYSSDGLLATLKNPRENTHTYTYDASGRLIRDEDPATGFKALARTETSLGWDVTLSTALNRTTTYKVENLTTGDLKRTVIDPSNLTTTTLRRADGTTTITSPDGTITTPVQGPDPRWGMQAPISKSLSVKLPSSLISTLTTTRTATLSNPADPLSLTTQTDTLVINGRTYSSVFNQAAKTLTTTTPAGRVSTVTLDALGRVIKEQVTGLEAVSYTYDAQGRLSTITQGTGATARTSTLSYNTKNELISITDPLTRAVGFAYDLAGRITTQTLPDLRTIGYGYDDNGNVTSITPPGKPAHAFSYTPVDLESAYNPPPLAASPSPLATPTAYTYNLDKQLTLVARSDGQTLTLGYDTPGGRLSTLTLPGPQTITYAYDPTQGTLTSITAPNSALSYTYDGSLLKTTTWAGTVAGNVSRNYDTNFRVASQSVNGANTISFGYDLDSLLTSAGSFTITRSAQNGLITGSTLGVATDTRTYSTFGELGTYTANVSGSPAFSVTYTRDKLGRITQKVETIGGVMGTFDYTYDLAGRLTDVTKNGTVIAHYTYDSNGNRLTQTDATGTVNGAYDAQDRLTAYGNLQFTYTTNGELVTKANPTLGQSITFTYDVLGNLTHVVLPNNDTIDYVIDGRQRRIGKKLNGTLVQGFLYENQLRVVAELDGSGNIASRFVYGTKDNVPDYVIKGGATYRIISDDRGSPRLVVNTVTGTVAQQIGYDEFGNILQDTNPGFQPFGFAGGLYDSQTGLIRFGRRDYDPQVGRWTVKDPILFGGGDTNLYAYTVNDPVNWIDPSGLACACSAASSPYTVEQLASVIYNETASLSGQGIFDARLNSAHVAVNRANAGIAGGVASSHLSTTAQQAINNGVPSAVSAYAQSVVAASLALGCEPDPTNGALNFNFRSNASLRPFYGNPVQTQVGPLNNSYPTSVLPSSGIYANTYGRSRP